MSADFFTQVALLSLFTVASYTIGRICFRLLQVELPNFAKAGAALLTGFALLVLQLGLYSLVGLKFNGFWLYTPWVLAGLVLLWNSRKAALPRITIEPLKWLHYWLDLSLLDKLISIILVGTLGALLVLQLSLPLYAWDVTAIWFQKAKHFYFFGGIDYSLVFDYSHKDYPVAYPLIVDAFYLIGIGFNDQLALGINYLFLLAACGLFYGFFRNKLPIWAALALPLTMLLMPPVYTMNFDRYYVAYADFPLGVVVLFYAVAFTSWVESEQASHLALTLIALALAGSMKNEGITFTLLGLLSIGIVLLIRYRQILSLLKSVRIMIVASILLFSILGWNFYTKLNKFETDISIGFNPDRFFEQLPERYDTIVKMIGSELASDVRYVGLGVMLLLGFASLFATRNRLSLALVLLWLVLWGQAAIYIAIYVITPLDIRYHISSTLTRLLTHLIPLAIFTFGLGLANLNQSNRRLMNQ
ncbi:MAG: hypothetical protein HXX08_07775 [Chloroflexi bacterium]|uniref:Glycosyltransferase RgtA/B/C/D-like domain-containing protein n=1 Tax=Candidatus Chlorohelix allophototropha TaxID=3003348 RepID=A0A8T7LZM4_9CHLR|nr:hypothetical protein [Chloroflexota bacterium]WJW67630.1 hypothetical protein OZ401_000900 [Chloroflexota bacterium L227-S17]